MRISSFFFFLKKLINVKWEIAKQEKAVLFNFRIKKRRNISKRQNNLYMSLENVSRSRGVFSTLSVNYDGAFAEIVNG